MSLTDDLKGVLRSKGAVLVGVGCMEEVDGCDYAKGVSVALPLPAHVAVDLLEAPTAEYVQLYKSLNGQLNDIVMAGEEFLQGLGYEARALTTDRAGGAVDQVVPHKTVATRAGIGWIGQNCLLVTQEYGSAIRISSLLTNAPLECDEPIDESKCGSCGLCVKACPGGALTGVHWKAGMARDQLVDVGKCSEAMEDIARNKAHIDLDICGKCFAVCPYTRRYAKREE